MEARSYCEEASSAAHVVDRCTRQAPVSLVENEAVHAMSAANDHIKSAVDAPKGMWTTRGNTRRTNVVARAATAL